MNEYPTDSAGGAAGTPPLGAADDDDRIGGPEPEAPDPFPWPPTEGEPVVAAAARTWRGASLEPRRFFGMLPAGRSIGPALIFYLVLGMAVAGAELFWAMVLPDSLDIGARFGMTEGASEWAPFIDFLLAPAMLLISLFLAAGITHLLLRLFGGATGGFNATTRVFAYAYSPQILAVVPLIGNMAGFVWMVVVAIIGLSAAHRTSTGRAAAAVLVPLALLVVLLAIAAFIAAAGQLIMR